MPSAEVHQLPYLILFPVPTIAKIENPILKIKIIQLDFRSEFTSHTTKKNQKSLKKCPPQLSPILTSRCPMKIPKVPFIYYVRTCIHNTKLNLTSKFFTKTVFSSNQKNFFFNMTFWRNFHLVIGIFLVHKEKCSKNSWKCCGLYKKKCLRNIWMVPHLLHIKIYLLR